MTGVPIDVPRTLRTARTAAGERVWLDALPELVGDAASRWSLTVGRAYDGFGMHALVVEATTADGTAAVLTPVGNVRWSGGEMTVGDGGAGEVTMGLRQQLVDIQRGRAEDPFGWVRRL